MLNAGSPSASFPLSKGRPGFPGGHTQLLSFVSGFSLPRNAAMEVENGYFIRVALLYLNTNEAQTAKQSGAPRWRCPGRSGTHRSGPARALPGGCGLAGPVGLSPRTWPLSPGRTAASPEELRSRGPARPAGFHAAPRARALGSPSPPKRTGLPGPGAGGDGWGRDGPQGKAAGSDADRGGGPSCPLPPAPPSWSALGRGARREL